MNFDAPRILSALLPIGVIHVISGKFRMSELRMLLFPADTLLNIMIL
jgi:hypothetical protein